MKIKEFYVEDSFVWMLSDTGRLFYMDMDDETGTQYEIEISENNIAKHCEPELNVVDDSSLVIEEELFEEKSKIV